MNDDAKRKDRWDKYDAEWEAKRILHEEDERKLAAYDALAESHAELVAALDAFAIKHLKSSWTGHFPSCAAVTHKRDAPPCSPRCAAAQSALTKARKL